MSSETAREAKIRHSPSALGESPCLSLPRCAFWDAPQMTQMASAIHERWQSLGSAAVTLTQNGSWFVRRARPRLAAARDVKHPALTTSFWTDTSCRTPIHLHSSRLLACLMGSALARRHIALKNMDFWFLDAYIEKKGSKALVNEVACLNVLPKRQAETK